jgi:hypothetical protein
MRQVANLLNRRSSGRGYLETGLEYIDPATYNGMSEHVTVVRNWCFLTMV